MVSIAVESVADLTYEEFVNLYFIPEKPVILTGVECLDRENCGAKYLQDRFVRPDAKRLGWYDAKLPSERDEFKTPGLILSLINDDMASLWKKPLRIWAHAKGNRTPWHYDNSHIHIFNLQLQGKKQWIIISPKTPLPAASFNHISLVRPDYVPLGEEFDYYQFELGAGDMLFLPRYWAHRVVSLAETNTSVNWCMTPFLPNLTSKAGVRETELLKLMEILPLVRFVSSCRITPKFVANYIKDIRSSSALARLFKEIVKLPRTLFFLGRYYREGQRYIKANFDV